jgi:hypothetical protein
LLHVRFQANGALVLVKQEHSPDGSIPKPRG